MKRTLRRDVSVGMRETGEQYVPGETVTLLRDVHVGHRVHEAGTRARVLADHGALVVLHLCDSSAEVVTCPAGHVERVVASAARTPLTRAA